MTSSWRFHNSTTSTGAIAALFSLHSFNSSMLLGLFSLVSARRARLVLTLDILWLCVEAKKETKFKLLHNAALYKRLERAPEMLLTIMPEKLKKEKIVQFTDAHFKAWRLLWATESEKESISGRWVDLNGTTDDWREQRRRRRRGDVFELIERDT